MPACYLGPWTLTQIELFDCNQVLLVDTLDDWSTQPYQLSEFEPPPAPVVTEVLPDYGPAWGGNEVILQGGYLDHISSITLGGNDVNEFEIMSDSAIRLTVPHAQNCSGDTVGIETITPWTTAVFPNVYTYIPGPGDFDSDCDVDFQDFSTFALAWLTEPGDARWDPACDISIPADSFIDTLDLAEFAENWLRSE